MSLIVSIVFVIISVFSLGLIVVINIHEKKELLNQRQDFIDIYVSKKKHELIVSQSPFSLQGYFLFKICIPLIFFVFIFLCTENFIIAIAISLSSIMLPDIITKGLQSKRQKQFEQRYESALNQLSSSLRSGLSIGQAVEDICKSPFIHNSIRDLFIGVNADLKVGISISDAFLKFAKECESQDAYDVAAAISMQVMVGGNEAKVVENVAKNISSRIMARREIKTTFADTKMTVMAMEIIPTLIVVGLCVMAKDYLSIYFTSLKMILIFIAIIGVMIAGTFVSKYMLNKNENTL